MASIEKRGNTYKITVSCGYDAKGNKLRKSTTFKPKEGLNEKQIKSAVDKYAIQFEEQILHGKVADTMKIKLCDFIPEYLEIRGQKLSPLTMELYKQIIRDSIEPNFGYLKLKDIRPAHVQHYILEIQKPKENGKVLSASTCHRYIQVLQSMMSTAYKLGYIDTNPAETARLDLPTVREAETDIFSRDEAATMLKALESEPLKYQVLIHLALVTGCRRGELMGLQWKHIDFEERTVRIEQSNYRAKDGTIQTKEPKTRSSIRTIAIPDYLARMLKDYKRAESKEPYGSHILWNTQGWVFSQWDGSPMYIDTISHWFDRFQKRHGIPHHKFHALRHSSASLALADGTNLKTVASRLGHSQLRTTNRYVHSIESADRQCADSFEALVQAAK